MSKIEVNTVAPQDGTTLTLGESGDTVTLGTGASQSGFGRTGTVDWQTTVKTSTFTAVSGEGYFINTTGGAVTVNLPAGAAGSIVSVKDYAGTFDTYACTLAPNGSEKIGGQALDSLLNAEGIAVTLVYIDSTQGWLVTDSGLQSEAPKPAFITATGGTITTVDTNYKVHTFTGPGTFTVCSVGNSAGSNEVSYMIAAAGGGGGGCIPNGWGGGGGGAGGFREGKTPQCTYTASPLACTSGSNNGIPVTATGYPIVVGGGGAAGPMAPAPGGGGIGGSGNTASAFGLTSAGGGGGRGGLNGLTGVNGGSGGGGSGNNPGPGAGTGNTPPVSPPQGNPAGVFSGAATTANYYGGSGGGGATIAGLPINMPAAANTNNGDGGTGATTSINGSPTAFAGGGGAGVYNNGVVAWAAGCGGAGGGGQGGARGGHPNGPRCSTAGTVNTGGGGGGAGVSGPAGPQGISGTPAAAGGSGIVVIRYKFQ